MSVGCNLFFFFFLVSPYQTIEISLGQPSPPSYQLLAPPLLASDLQVTVICVSPGNMFPLYKVMCNVCSVSIGAHALLIIIASHTYTTNTIIIHVDGGNQAIHLHSAIIAKLCCDLAM